MDPRSRLKKYSKSLPEGGEFSHELDSKFNLDPINHFKDLQTDQLYSATYMRW